MSLQAELNLVVALPSEAQPLVQHFALAVAAENPFRIFAGDGIRLVVSGMGAEASAAAVGYLAGQGGADGVWLNVGIAGHAHAAIGSVVVAGRVRRHGSERAYFPTPGFSHSLAVADVITYDQAVTDYPANACCDMEAAGFMNAANRVAAVDFVQVCKVISDNPSQRLDTLTRTRIRALIEDAVPNIRTVADALRTLAVQTQPAAHGTGTAAPELPPAWRLSHSLRLQFARELARYKLLTQNTSIPATVTACTDGREALARLRTLVQQHVPKFDL